MKSLFNLIINYAGKFRTIIVLIPIAIVFLISAALTPANITDYCEQFSSPNFPPQGWTLYYTDTLYWSRVLQSSYGLGIGSAKFDNWDAQTGITQSLESPLFTPIDSGAVLFSNAFQPWPTYYDSLFIQTSADSGRTYVTLKKYGPNELATTTGNPFPYSPEPSHWKKRVAGPMPAGTNRVRFTCRSGWGDNLYLDSLCLCSGYPLCAIIGVEPISNIIPDKFSLEQNYPNPFNPSTKIRFSISTPLNPPFQKGGTERSSGGLVRLVVYDAIGSIVETLVNENLKAGTYEVVWDAAKYSSGVYFYKLEVNTPRPDKSGHPSQEGTYTITKKMVLLK